MSDTSNLPPPPPDPHAAEADPAGHGGDDRTSKPWFKRPLGIIGIAIGVIVLFAAIGSGGEDAPDEPAAAPETEATTDEVDEPAEESATEPEPDDPEPEPEPDPEPEPEPEPEPDPEPTFEPVTLEGSGDDIVDLPAGTEDILVATISHEGSRNFAVQSYGNGQRIDLLVNHIGPYTGTVPLNFTDEPDELEINADGPWTVTVSSVFGQPILDDSIEGTGDEVVVIATDAGRLNISHDGERNFAVLSYGNRRELLVNEIGTYEGTVRLGSDALVLEINADGNWRIESQ